MQRLSIHIQFIRSVFLCGVSFMLVEKHKLKQLETYKQPELPVQIKFSPLCARIHRKWALQSIRRWRHCVSHTITNLISHSIVETVLLVGESMENNCRLALGACQKHARFEICKLIVHFRLKMFNNSATRNFIVLPDTLLQNVELVPQKPNNQQFYQNQSKSVTSHIRHVFSSFKVS